MGFVTLLTLAPVHGGTDNSAEGSLQGEPFQLQPYFATYYFMSKPMLLPTISIACNKDACTSKFSKLTAPAVN